MPATNTEDLRWVTSAMLVALAGRNMRKGQTFTSKDMPAWVPGLGTGAKRKHASETLIRLGFVTHEMCIDEAGKSYAKYTITADGDVAIKAIASGQQLTSGPKGPHQVDRTPPNTSFVARLWALLRARGMLDSNSAAATLVDAGEDVEKAAKNAQRYFARWASVGGCEESRLREANGCKRYVISKDAGPNPPAWTPKAKARRAAQTTE